MTDDDIVRGVAERLRAGPPADSTWRSSALLPGVAAARDVERVERLIGHALPTLLRRLYLEVCDGGFGPQGGIYGVGLVARAGGEDPELLQGYLDVLSGDGVPDAPPVLPQGVVFLCDYGCSAWALLDCRSPTGQLWWWDQGSRWVLDLTLAGWLEGWLRGEEVDLRSRADLYMPDHPEQWLNPDLRSA